MIRMMCGVRLVDRVLTDALRHRVGVAVKIEYVIIQKRLWWYGHVVREEINSQIRKLKKLEKGRRVGQGTLGRVLKEGSGTIWLEKIGCIRSKEMARTNSSKNC